MIWRAEKWYVLGWNPSYADIDTATTTLVHNHKGIHNHGKKTFLPRVLLFDHNLGYDKRRAYRFTVTRMNRGYGKAQQEIHKTNTNQEVS